MATAKAVDPRVERSRAVALRAAREILAQEGWEAVTHVRVAQRSALGRATIYRQWPDALALRRDALAEEVSDFHVTPTGDLRADLVAELEAIRYEMVERAQANVIVAVINQAHRDSKLEQFRASVIAEGSSLLRRLVAEAVRRGELARTCDPDDAIAVLIGPLVWRRIFESRPITGAFIGKVVDGFLAVHAKPSRR